MPESLRQKEKVKSHILNQLERLEKEGLDGDRLQDEVGRTLAMSKAAKRIMRVNSLLCRAKHTSENILIGSKILPEILEE